MLGRTRYVPLCCHYEKLGLSNPPQEITVHPVADGSFISLAAYCADYDREGTPYNGPEEENIPGMAFLADFHGWEPEVQTLIEVRILSFPVAADDTDLS